MTRATRQIQITVRAANQPALLGRLMAIAVSCGAEVLAASSHWDGSGTVVNLVTEDAVRTGRALTAAGFDCESNFVVLIEIPDKPGLPAVLADRLNAVGIDVLHSYASHSDDHRSHVVFQTSDDARAIYLLEVDALIHQLAAAQRWQPSSGRETAGAFTAQHVA